MESCLMKRINWHFRQKCHFCPLLHCTCKLLGHLPHLLGSVLPVLLATVSQDSGGATEQRADVITNQLDHGKSVMNVKLMMEFANSCSASCEVPLCPIRCQRDWKFSSGFKSTSLQKLTNFGWQMHLETLMKHCLGSWPIRSLHFTSKESSYAAPQDDFPRHWSYQTYEVHCQLVVDAKRFSALGIPTLFDLIPAVSSRQRIRSLTEYWFVTSVSTQSLSSATAANLVNLLLQQYLRRETQNSGNPCLQN